MNDFSDWRVATDLARLVGSEVAEYAQPHDTVEDKDKAGDEPSSLRPEEALLNDYDRRITDSDLRAATRTRFVAQHYADAVEAGVKALNECIRKRTGSSDDGDALMTQAFSPNSPLLRINKGRSKSDESAQRGHMHLCQGVIGAWRNPRAHNLTDDPPKRALMMLETLNDLIEVTKAATRSRKRKKT